MESSSPKPGLIPRFEHRKQPLLPRTVYIRRLLYAGFFTASVLTVWIILGMLGYHFLGRLGWIDSFLNTAMIVGGMGPVDTLRSSASKIFAGFYAILSGVIFLSAFAIVAAPIFHRFLHKFHLEVDEKTGRKEIKKS